MTVAEDPSHADLKGLAALLTPRQRRLALLLLGLMLTGGIAELLSIGAIVPFLALLADSETFHRFAALEAMIFMAGNMGSDIVVAPAADDG